MPTHEKPIAEGDPRDRLLRAGLEMVDDLSLSKSFAGVTTAKVAAAAGVTTGSFFHHFDTHAEFVDALATSILPAPDDLTPAVDEMTESLLIDELAFRRYCVRHQRVADAGISIVPEGNGDMTGSYAMVDPAGRFFDNTAGQHHYSRPILDVGVADAWRDIRFDAQRFEERGGVYDWRAPGTSPLIQLRRGR